ncbi:gp53-like domain-containing protein [Roseomonas elaeocarpi]|uniref:Putative tail fiber protein gp53-like C-terminal domain-containing protein n=1 Tax=Roseomonas elaeocarpi TaxID=907779 RepID=A0ABV6JQ99_9PROT
MHRIDSAGAATSLPAPAAAGTAGYWTKGDPVSGVQATVIDPDWLNSVQEELLAVLVAGAITPSKTNRAQLLAALYGLFPGMASTGRALTNPGYIRLPGGLILQWVRNKTATADSSGAASNTWAYPVTFPTAVLGYSYTATNESTGTDVGRVQALAPNLSYHQLLHLGAPSGAAIAFSGFIVGY